VLSTHTWRGTATAAQVHRVLVYAQLAEQSKKQSTYTIRKRSCGLSQCLWWSENRLDGWGLVGARQWLAVVQPWQLCLHVFWVRGDTMGLVQ
jgi:hypothetical protein